MTTITVLLELTCQEGSEMSRVIDTKEVYHLVKCRNLAGGCYDASGTVSVSVFLFAFLFCMQAVKLNHRTERNDA